MLIMGCRKVSLIALRLQTCRAGAVAATTTEEAGGRRDGYLTVIGPDAVPGSYYDGVQTGHNKLDG